MIYKSSTRWRPRITSRANSPATARYFFQSVPNFWAKNFDILPSQAHPSYPYGNPTNVKHPATRPRPPYDPSSHALFEDMGYDGGGINGAVRWRDLATELLLPVDEEKEGARRAFEARKMASGAASNTAAPRQDQTDEEEEEEEENDENMNENEEDDEDEETEGEEDTENRNFSPP
ncbi:hypothetical protein B0H13DRAFT_2013534 [Mycena leptocephala]|nr:hypothetical protein B0H13DRAFT_2013534 [Mycena leptocephala]